MVIILLKVFFFFYVDAWGASRYVFNCHRDFSSLVYTILNLSPTRCSKYTVMAISACYGFLNLSNAIDNHIDVAST